MGLPSTIVWYKPCNRGCFGQVPCEDHRCVKQGPLDALNKGDWPCSFEGHCVQQIRAGQKGRLIESVKVAWVHNYAAKVSGKRYQGGCGATGCTLKMT